MRFTVDYPDDIDLLCFSPGGTRLALSGRPGDATVLVVVEVPSGKEVARFTGLKGIEGVRFRSEEELFVFHGAECRLCAVNEGGPRVLWQADVAERGGVYNGVPSPDGKTLAMGTDGDVTLLDVATKQVRRRLPTPLDGVALATAFSPDGRYLAATSSSDDWPAFGFILVWDVLQEKRARLIKLQVRDIDALAFRPDNRMLAAAAGSVDLFDMHDPRSRRGALDDLSKITLTYGIGWTEPIASHFVGSGFYQSLRFSANGKVLKVVCFGGDVVRISPQSGRVLSRSRPPDGQEIWATAVSDTGLAAAAVKDSNSIVLWDVPRWADA